MLLVWHTGDRSPYSRTRLCCVVARAALQRVTSVQCMCEILEERKMSIKFWWYRLQSRGAVARWWCTRRGGVFINQRKITPPCWDTSLSLCHLPKWGSITLSPPPPITVAPLRHFSLVFIDTPLFFTPFSLLLHPELRSYWCTVSSRTSRHFSSLGFQGYQMNLCITKKPRYESMSYFRLTCEEVSRLFSLMSLGIIVVLLYCCQKKCAVVLEDVIIPDHIVLCSLVSICDSHNQHQQRCRKWFSWTQSERKYINSNYNDPVKSVIGLGNKWFHLFIDVQLYVPVITSCYSFSFEA